MLNKERIVEIIREKYFKNDNYVVSFEKSAKAIIAEMTEKISLPLPVLADIKGATIRQVKADTGQWFMSIRMGKGKNKQINAFYYEYLENLAREYLNTLEDKNKGE